jgi:hypothetical protein
MLAGISKRSIKTVIVINLRPTESLIQLFIFSNEDWFLFMCYDFKSTLNFKVECEKKLFKQLFYGFYMFSKGKFTFC